MCFRASTTGVFLPLPAQSPMCFSGPSPHRPRVRIRPLRPPSPHPILSSALISLLLSFQFSAPHSPGLDAGVGALSQRQESVPCCRRRALVRRFTSPPHTQNPACVTHSHWHEAVVRWRLGCGVGAVFGAHSCFAHSAVCSGRTASTTTTSPCGPLPVAASP
jgi:hypothetical protein